MALINFSGIASGIDSGALIDAIIEQKRSATVKPLETKASAYGETNAAFGELKTLLANLKSAADGFRAINGSALVKQVTSTDETIAGGTATGAAANGSYTLTISQLAKNATFSFNDRPTDGSSKVAGSLVGSDTVTFTVGTGAEQETIELTVDNQTTYDDLVSAFNGATTKANASLVNVGTSASPSYAFTVVTNNTGTEQGNLAVSVGANITASGALTASTTSQATNARFTVSGISSSTIIERSSNSVSDLVSGVTFTLAKTGSATLKVADDASASAAAVQEFVDAYNEVVRYIGENDTVTRQEDGETVENIFGALAATSIDENLVSALRTSFSSAATSGRAVSTLADLGIITERDGTLSFNADTFTDALGSDAQGVTIVTQNLGEELAAVGGTIDQFTRFNGIIDTAFNANASQVTQIQSQISDIEGRLAKEKAALTQRFSRLEGLIGSLNAQQSALSGILPG